MTAPAGSEPTRFPYGQDPSQFVDLYHPTDPEPGRGTVVSIHGGYWRAKWALDLNGPICRHLAARGWRVANIEYRRITDDRAPSVFDEMSADVIAAAATATDRLGGPGPTIAVGHSAGGHLALWLAATDLPHRAGLDGVVALAPVADLSESDRLGSSDHAARALMGGPADELTDRYRAASPSALVPLGMPQLVVHGDADDSVPQSMSIDYGARAAAAGDEVELVTPEGVDHFHLIDPDHDVWRTIDEWIDGRAGTRTDGRLGDRDGPGPAGRHPAR